MLFYQNNIIRSNTASKQRNFPIYLLPNWGFQEAIFHFCMTVKLVWMMMLILSLMKALMDNYIILRQSNMTAQLHHFLDKAMRWLNSKWQQFHHTDITNGCLITQTLQIAVWSHRFYKWLVSWHRYYKWLITQTLQMVGFMTQTLQMAGFITRILRMAGYEDVL